MEQLDVNNTLADFLVLHGACSLECAEEFAKQARSSWRPLGRILRGQGVLTLRDIAKVVNMQADRPSVLFGDAAVELGVCTREQIDAARAEQKANCPHIIDLALEDPRVDRARCLAAIREYVRFAERVLDQLAQSFPDLGAVTASGTFLRRI